jgi:hypothetical protein
MTQPNIRRLRQKVGPPGAPERRFRVDYPVWTTVKTWREKIAGFFRMDWDEFRECLTHPDLYAVLVGALCFVSMPGEPLGVRLLLAAFGFVAGWGLVVIALLFAHWVRSSYEKHPAPWVLLGLVALLYWLP